MIDADAPALAHPSTDLWPSAPSSGLDLASLLRKFALMPLKVTPASGSTQPVGDGSATRKLFGSPHKSQASNIIEVVTSAAARAKNPLTRVGTTPCGQFVHTGGHHRRPSLAVEQWVKENVPRRSAQEVPDYRIALRGLGGQPAVVRRRLPPMFVQRDRLNRPIVVDEAAPPPPVALLRPLDTWMPSLCLMVEVKKMKTPKMLAGRQHG